ncbi:MAG TPA: DUF3631 domain-containing protein [Dehalococcoidia bacterium]|nr:DUF3631 domain-containing protein [Dehalococcoidia bacterium]
MLLETTALIVPKPVLAANLTPATVFRVIERWKPTLLIDEMDTFVSDKSELRGVLNSGHNRATAFVLRCVGDGHEPRQFRTWAPKAFACIGRLPDTLEDRSIKIELKRKLKTTHVDPLPADNPYHELRRKAARWVADNFDAIAEAKPAAPEELSDRQKDNWAPLLSIAEIAGGEWPDLARAAARKFGVVEDDEGIRERLLKDIAAIFDREGDDLHSGELVNELLRIEGSPWAEFSRGQPISKTKLAWLLKPFSVFPRNIRIRAVTRKGYSRDRFAAVFRRYIDGYAEAGGDQTVKPLKRKVNQRHRAAINRSAGGGV